MQRRIIKSVVVAGLGLVSLLGCRSPYYADRGAGVGAVTGALAGAAIGNHNGNTAAGALIGTAVGAVAGAAVGQTIDDEVARNNAIIEARMGRQLAGAVSVGDAIAMTHAGVGDDVIVSHIRNNGVVRPPTVDDVIAMHDQGVSDTVIKAMHNVPPPVDRVARPVRPVIIEEHYYDPWCHRPYWHYRHHHHHHHHPGVHWGVSFSN
jgi:hypothetical protein